MNKTAKRDYFRRWHLAHYVSHPRVLTGRTEKSFKQRREYSNNKAKSRLAWISDVKRRSCLDCGVQYDPWVMHFDHRNPKTKYKEISKLYTSSIMQLFLEIEKCDIICANCHAERVNHVI